MPAAAQWVELEACGRTGPPETSEVYDHFAPAPNLGRFYVWAPAVTMVAEMRVPPGAIACTGVIAGNQRWLVVGGFDAVRCKIAPQQPYCKGTR